MSGNGMTMSYSKYYEQLDGHAQARYREKLDMAGLTSDPYNSKNFVTDSKLWPEIEYPDIYNYFINSTSFYTKEQMKAYKSMDGYNFFIQGWVGKVQVQVECKVVVVKASVRHSQSISSPLLHPWVAAERNGTIICAHCTCMAGLGEACSHIAALLFAVEANTLMRKNTSCTSGPCSWLLPGCRKVEYAPISDIDFRSSRKKRGIVESGSCKSEPGVCKDLPTDEEMAKLYGNLSQSGIKSAILSLVPKYCDNYIPRVAKGALPKPLTDLYNQKCYEITSFSDLLHECDKVHTLSTTMHEDHCQAIEQETRSQFHCKLWYVYRAGRITASNFKGAVHTSLTNPSPSLIKRICYPESYKFTTEATQWGIDHEDLAKALFSEAITTSHVNLQVHSCGLIIHPSCSYLGASPDSIVECDCCGRGVLEVKCPYQCKDQSFKNASENPSFCLDYVCDSIPTSFALRSNHSYFYQVQLQMKVCAVYYCYFVVWSPSELAIIKIDYNDSFVEAAVGKALQFFKFGVLPELVGRWYSSPRVVKSTSERQSEISRSDDGDDDDNAWCYCGRTAAAGDLIGCDNKSCPIMWFHMNCLNIDSIPDGKWLCPDCQLVNQA